MFLYDPSMPMRPTRDNLLASLALAFVSLAVIAIVLAVKSSIDTVASWATVIACFGSFSAGAWRIAKGYSRGEREAFSAATDAYALEVLAIAVLDRCRQEEARALDGIDPISVQWEATRRNVVGDVDKIYGNGILDASNLPLRGELLQGAAKYDLLPHRQLVVLGEPGAGKSVFVTLLTLDLLEQREEASQLPVLLRASSWNPRAQTFSSWVQRSLRDDYPEIFGQFLYADRLVSRLVDGGRILPVVDGLDEIAEGLRPFALRSLNQTTHDRPLIVSCRSAEYEAALQHETPLATAAVIELKPVQLTDAVEYLGRSDSRHRDSWMLVLESLRADPSYPLAQVLTSPLMISLARVAYSFSENRPEELLDRTRYPSVSTVEDALIAAYLPRAYGVGSPLVPQASAEKDYRTARRYLPFIAKNLVVRETTDIAWWQLYLALSRSSSIALLLCFVTFTAIIVSYVAFAFIQHQDRALFLALIVGIGCGSTAGIACLFGKIPNEPVRLRPQLQVLNSRPDLIRSAAVGGLAPGLIVTAILAPYTSASISVIAGLTVFAAVALLSATLRWSSPAERARAASPQYILDIDRAATVTQGVLVAASASIIFGLIFFGATHSFVAALSGVMGGCFLGLGAMLGTAWTWYQVAKARLVLKKQLPLRLNEFLSTACDAGVLRRSGAVYQFRHARLRDFLANGA